MVARIRAAVCLALLAVLPCVAGVTLRDFKNAQYWNWEKVTHDFGGNYNMPCPYAGLDTLHQCLYLRTAMCARLEKDMFNKHVNGIWAVCEPGQEDGHLGAFLEYMRRYEAKGCYAKVDENTFKSWFRNHALGHWKQPQYNTTTITDPKFWDWTHKDLKRGNKGVRAYIKSHFCSFLP
jgi:hypothetical protein